LNDAYRDAGVDLEAAGKAVELIKEIASGATRPEVEGEIGGFAGSFRLPDGRSLVAGTDGVGTKTEIARILGRYDTIGIDLVAMCADDVVCTGAEPVLFLDYVAIGKLDPEKVADLVKGIAEGCRWAGCALLGGETAEHPGAMPDDQFDLAGFCVGILDEANAIGPKRVAEGDLLVGLASSGLHSNGYSLVRRVLVDSGPFKLDQVPFGLERTLGDELLEPTRIYSRLIADLSRRSLIRAAAHITGGGIHENVPRMLPTGLGAHLEARQWPVPPIFALVQQAAGATREEMHRTLNMGLGMVVAVDGKDADQVVQRSIDEGIPAWVVGRITAGAGVTIS
jgi:phosphoribosylformylglycinamidine cyclo-ligase